MGVYDCYGKHGIQMKIGPCELKQYNEGDKVDILDGIYVANEGIVVIHNGKLLATYETLYDKYGSVLEIKDIWKNPMNQIIENELAKIEEDNNE